MAKYNFKRILNVSSISFLFLFILLFAFFGSRNLIFGVKIKNVNITDGTKVENNIINVTGVAKNALQLSLNDRTISIDQQGNFNETIALLPGYNTVSIEAKDKFGHNDEKIYKLIY